MFNTNKITRRTVINGIVYKIISGGELKINGDKRILIRDDDKSKEQIIQRFFNDKWISNSDYLHHTHKSIDFDDKSKKKKQAIKETLYEFKSFFEKLDKKGFGEEVLENVYKRGVFDKKEEDLLTLSPSEFQDYCIRMLLNYDLTPLKDKKVGRGELKRNISSYISRYLEYHRDLIKKDLDEGRNQGILEAGIFAAYEYAFSFIKNKKGNENLCTNDNLDKKYKTDYIKIVQDDKNFPDKIYFIQIKSNRKLAEESVDEIVKGQQEYLNSFTFFDEESFKNMRMDFMDNFLEDFVKKEDSLNKYKKDINIGFAKEFISQVIYVDLNNNKQYLIKETPLTFLYK